MFLFVYCGLAVADILDLLLHSKILIERVKYIKLRMVTKYALVAFHDNSVIITDKKEIIKYINDEIIIVRCRGTGSYVGKLIATGSKEKCLKILTGLRTIYLKKQQILLNPVVLLEEYSAPGINKKHTITWQHTVNESAASEIVYSDMSSPELIGEGKCTMTCPSANDICTMDNIASDTGNKYDNEHAKQLTANEPTVSEVVYSAISTASHMSSPELFFDGDSSSTWCPSGKNSCTPSSIDNTSPLSTTSFTNINEFVTPIKSKTTESNQNIPVRRRLSFDFTSHGTSQQSSHKLTRKSIHTSITTEPKEVVVTEAPLQISSSSSNITTAHRILTWSLPEVQSISPKTLSMDSCAVSSSIKQNKKVVSTSLKMVDSVTVEVDDSSVPKLYYCSFCSKQVRRYGRHITTVHKYLPQIKDINALPAFSNERTIKIAKLRKAAQFEFNTNFKENKKLLVTYRTSLKHMKAAADYLPCPNCKSYYGHKTLTLHYKRCTQQKCGKGIKRLGRMLTEKKYPEYLDQLKVILSKARQDNITEIIKNDESILLFGARLCSKFKFQPHLDSLIRHHLRLLAKLLHTMKMIDPSIMCLLDCFKVDQWKNIISAVMKFCNYDSEKRQFLSPASAIHLGTVLQNCCTALISHYIQIHCDTVKCQIESFKSLVRTEYHEAITRVSMSNLADNRRKNRKVVPVTDDIIKLNTYINTEAAKAFQILQREFCYSSWYNLACFTMIHILLFNRRRTGETERLRIDNYNAKQKIQKDSDTYHTLTESEKCLSEKFYRMEIRGKWERNVPVLLTNITVLYIDTILQYRTNAKVSPNNPYIFGLSFSQDSHLSATKILRESSTACGAMNPLTLRGTFLRKQIATLTQVMNLSDNDVSLLANYMGHSKYIHLEHYKKTDSTLQIARISKLLMLFNNGQLQQYKNCTLEEIDNLDVPDQTDKGEENVDNRCSTESVKNGCINNSIDNSEQSDINRNKNIKFITPTKIISPIKKQTFNMKSQLSPRLVPRISPQISPHKLVNIPTPGRRRRFSHKISWTNKEKKLVTSVFGDYIKNLTPPPKILCINTCMKYSELKNRTGVLLYAYICNLIKHKAMLK